MLLCTKGVHLIDTSGSFVTNNTKRIRRSVGDGRGDRIGESSKAFIFDGKSTQVLQYADAIKYAKFVDSVTVFLLIFMLD